MPGKLVGERCLFHEESIAYDFRRDPTMFLNPHRFGEDETLSNQKLL